MSPPNVEWINNSESLEHYCNIWQHLPRLALDTEFIKTKTYYPIAGLVQVGHESNVWLIDPLTINDWQSFAGILRNNNIVKIMHSATEDLSVFHQLTGELPKSLFDTQLAASFIGLKHCLSYQNIVNHYLDVHIDKDQTRSNWLNRPLTLSQIDYASMDVFHLYKIYSQLKTDLNKAHHEIWHKEDCEQLLKKFQSPNRAWQKIKKAWQLTPRQLALLEALHNWREKEAKHRNIPKKHVLDSNILWVLAYTGPTSIDEIVKHTGIPNKQLHKLGKSIISIVIENANKREDQLPPTLLKPLPYHSKKELKLVKTALQSIAKKEKIAPELLSIKALSTQIMQVYIVSGKYQTPDNITGWRRCLLEQKLNAEIELFHQNKNSTYSNQNIQNNE